MRQAERDLPPPFQPPDEPTLYQRRAYWWAHVRTCADSCGPSGVSLCSWATARCAELWTTKDVTRDLALIQVSDAMADLGYSEADIRGEQERIAQTFETWPAYRKPQDLRVLREETEQVAAMHLRTESDVTRWMVENETILAAAFCDEDEYLRFVEDSFDVRTGAA